jgi:hypothetical protein
MLLCKKEIYYRLGTLVAPDYNVETQFTKLLKGDRWEHYYNLLQFVLQDIQRMESSGGINTIAIAETIIQRRNGTMRNYRLSVPFTGSVTVSGVTSTEALVDWTKFLGSEFSYYLILVGEDEIYDPYATNIYDIYYPSLFYGTYATNIFKDENIKQRLIVKDVHQNKCRLKALTPATLHYLTLVYWHRTGYRDIVSTTFTTGA